MNWTRTSYLFLVMIMISVGVTSAYAITITLGADPVVITGDLDLRGTSGADDDTIFFDELFEGSQQLQWDDSDARFEFSDDLALFGTIQTGSISVAPVAYNRMGTTIAQATGGPIVDAADLFVSGDIEVGGELYVLGPSGTGNDLIFFDAFEGPSFGWDDTDTRFEFSDAVAINNGDLDLSGFSSTDNDIIRFDDTFQTLTWNNGNDRFEFSNDLDVLGLTVTEGSLNVATGNAIVGGDLDLTGFSATDDDTIFFDDGTTTFLRWDESPFGEFVFSDNVFIDGLLDIEVANDSPLFLDRTGSDGTLIDFARDGAPVGDIVVAGGTISYNPFTGSHYAWTTQEPQRGMVVSMNGQNKYLHDNPEAEILYGVDITTKKNDPAVLGTFLILHESLSASGLVNPLLVMAEGNGEVWVADMGEDIHPGDYLISSSVVGHAMKDDRSEELSHIIGRAAEPIDWSEVNETINGVKHKKISILFNFVPLNNIVE